MYLSKQLRQIVKFYNKDDMLTIQNREVMRIHNLIKIAKKNPTNIALLRGKEYELCVKKPRQDKTGLSQLLFKNISEHAILIASEYEIDDGCLRQQHGDLLFWQPAITEGDASAPNGRWIVIECKRLIGGYWIEYHSEQRLENVKQQSKRITERLKSWLTHLCKYDEMLDNCAVIKDGVRCISTAILTEKGLVFID